MDGSTFFMALTKEMCLIQYLVRRHVAELPGPIHLVSDAPDLHVVRLRMAVGGA